MSAAGSEDGVEAARDWLGGEAAGKTLRVEIVEIMLSGFEHDPGVWSMDDVRMLDEVKAVDVADTKALWLAYLEDSAEHSTEHELNKSLKLLFVQWLVKRFNKGRVEDGTLDEVYTPSNAEKADMIAQGMTEPAQMRYLELALHIGRLGGEKEIVGGEYGISPTTMAGSTKAFKTGAPMLPSLIKQGLKDKSDTAVAKHITNVARAMGASREPFYKSLSSHLYRFWMRTTENLPDPVARLLYVQDMRYDAYVGRGLPELYDPEVGQRALTKANELLKPKQDEQQKDDRATAQDKQMRELLASNERLAKSVAQLTDQVGKMKNQKGGPPPGPPGDDLNDGRCYKCNEKGHKAKFCPNDKASES